MGRKSKKDYMRDGIFADLMEAAEQALVYERSARDGYRVTQVESTESPRKDPVGEAVFPKGNPSSRRKRKNAADR
jgi:hypothetical protein